MMMRVSGVERFGRDGVFLDSCILFCTLLACTYIYAHFHALFGFGDQVAEWAQHKKMMVSTHISSSRRSST